MLACHWQCQLSVGGYARSAVASASASAFPHPDRAQPAPPHVERVSSCICCRASKAFLWQIDRRTCGLLIPSWSATALQLAIQWIAPSPTVDGSPEPEHSQKVVQVYVSKSNPGHLHCLSALRRPCRLALSKNVVPFFRLNLSRGDRATAQSCTLICMDLFGRSQCNKLMILASLVLHFWCLSSLSLTLSPI